MLKQGLNNSKIAFKASVFNPCIAKHLYSTFVKEGGVIYDYSMGFGQRLLGALSLPYKVKYIGVDPMEKTFEANNNLFSFFKENDPGLNKEVDLHCIGSEDFCPEEHHDKVDFAFSSPPYFNVEVYEKNTTQAYDNGSYPKFINVWWNQVVKNMKQMIKKDGILGLNICEKVGNFAIESDMCNVITNNGFELIDTYQMQISKNIKFGNRKGEHKYESIFIFKNIK